MVILERGKNEPVFEAWRLSRETLRGLGLVFGFQSKIEFDFVDRLRVVFRRGRKKGLFELPRPPSDSSLETKTRPRGRSKKETCPLAASQVADSIGTGDE
jgi:hypothetical protein